jgi:uncharacterized delta-60 repeat protein
MVISFLWGCGGGNEKSTNNVDTKPDIDSIPDITDLSFGIQGNRKSTFTGTPFLIDGRDMDVNEEGDIVIAGHYETVETNYKQTGVMLMDANGSLIETFGNKGQAHIQYALNTVGNNVAFQGNKIVLGSQQGPYVVISRIDKTGNFDTSFRNTGYFREERISPLTSEFITEMIVDDSNRIYVSGYITPNDLFLLRYLPNGEPDVTFGTDGIVKYSYDKVLKAGQLSLSKDGRIMLAATVSQSSNEFRSAVIAFFEDGSIDSSFGNDGISIVDYQDGERGLLSRGITTDLQGRIIVVNSNNTSAYSTRAVIYRLDVTGKLDLEFGNNGLTVIEDGFSLGLFKPKMDADKIVIGGYLRESLLKTDPFVVRLIDSGKLDSTFGNAGKGIIDVGELAEARDTIIYGGRYYLGGWAFSDKSFVAATKR